MWIACFWLTFAKYIQHPYTQKEKEENSNCFCPTVLLALSLSFILLLLLLFFFYLTHFFSISFHFNLFMYVARCSHSHLLNSYSTHSWLLMLISFLYFPRLSNFCPKRKKRTRREKSTHTHHTLRTICRLQFAKVNTFDFS